MGNQSAPLDKAKTVVVIGGGYAGTAVAQKLDDQFNVIMIDRKNYKLHNVGALRACVEPEFTKKILIPYNRVLKNGIVINGEVLSMTEKSVTVQQGEKKKEVIFDYCVIATGTDYAFPLRQGLKDGKKVFDEYKTLSEEIGKASHIVCIGAGPVGLELVGEIASLYKDEMKSQKKKITLLHQADKILNRYNYLTDKMRNRIVDKLKNGFFNVDIRLGEGLVSEKPVDEDNGKKTDSDNTNNNDNSKEEEKKVDTSPTATSNENRRYSVGKRIITTSKQNTIECDLIFYCNGSSVSRFTDETFLKDCVNPSNGRIRVKKNLQIEKTACEHIFALGDCADHSPQFAYVAAEQADVVAHNVKNLEKGRALKDYAMGMYAMLLPLGKQDGVSQMPGSFVVGGSMTSNFKGKTLFTEKYWKECGFEEPPNQLLFSDDKSIPLEKTYLSNDRLTQFADKTKLTRSDLIGLISGNWDTPQENEEKKDQS